MREVTFWKGKAALALLPLMALLGLLLVVVMPWGGPGGDVAVAQGVHTRPPTQEDIDRCLRERAAHDQRMSDAWRVANPGKPVPSPRPWPEYPCGPIYEVDPGTALTLPPTTSVPRPDIEYPDSSPGSPSTRTPGSNVNDDSPRGIIDISTDDPSFTIPGAPAKQRAGERRDAQDERTASNEALPAVPGWGDGSFDGTDGSGGTNGGGDGSGPITDTGDEGPSGMSGSDRSIWDRVLDMFRNEPIAMLLALVTAATGGWKTIGAVRKRRRQEEEGDAAVPSAVVQPMSIMIEHPDGHLMSRNEMDQLSPDKPDTDGDGIPGGPDDPIPPGWEPPPSQIGVVNTTGHRDGDTWSEDLGNGEVATHHIVEGTGGQTVDTRIRRADGSFTDVRSVADGEGGWTSWADNSDGSGSYAQKQGADGDHETMYWDQNPGMGPAVVQSASNSDNSQGTIVAHNPDGTVSTGDYQRLDGNTMQTNITNADGSATKVTSSKNAEGKTNSLVEDKNGRRVVEQDGTVTQLDERGNVLDEHGDIAEKPGEGRVYNPDTGTWVGGQVDPESGLRAYTLDDGSTLIERSHDDSGSEWVLLKPNGDYMMVTKLGFDPETGKPKDIETLERPLATSSPDHDWSWDSGDTAGLAADIPNSALDELLKQSMKESAPSAGEKWAARVARGQGFGIGAAIGAASDIHDGMDADEAIVSNTAGSLAGAGAGALIGMAIGGPVGAAVGFGANVLVSYWATNYIQDQWEKNDFPQ